MGIFITGNTVVGPNPNISAGRPDTTFVTGVGFNNQTLAIKIQSDQKVLVTGQFTSYSGVTANRIIRLNSDGSIDSTFNTGTGFNTEPYAVEIQPDNKILVGGGFITYSGVTERRIVRLNSDGSIDNTFDAGLSFSGVAAPGLTNIKLQNDGKILTTGFFTTYSGQSVSTNIARLNSDGSLDTTFTGGTGFSTNSIITSVQIQSDGKIICGGSFTTYSGVSRSRIIRLNSDGSVDDSFNIGVGFNGNVLSLKVQPDGKILASGSFSTYSGVSAGRIIRLNSDGSVDNTFNSSGVLFNGNVAGISLQSDGKMILGGLFTAFKGEPRNRIIRLNPDGSEDVQFIVGGNISFNGFNSTTIGSFNDTAIQSLPNFDFFIGGNFVTYKGETYNRIIKIKGTDINNN